MAGGFRGVWHAWLVACLLAGLVAGMPVLSSAQHATPEPDETASQDVEVAQESEVVAPSPDSSASQELPEPTPPPTTTVSTATAELAPEPEPNHDTLIALASTDPVTLSPGQTRELAFSYAVTTARLGTRIHAEVRGADGALAGDWLLQAQVGQAGWTGDGSVLEITERTAVTPHTSFAVTFRVGPPATMTATETVTLHLRSTVITPSGAHETAIEGVYAEVAAKPLDNGAELEGSTSPGSEGPVQLMAVDAGVITCLQISPGDDVLGAGEYVLFKCDNLGDDEYYLRVSNVTLGWRWSAYLLASPPDSDPPYTAAGWYTSTSTTVTLGRSGPNISVAYIALSPDPERAAPGAGSMDIEFIQGTGAYRGKPYDPPHSATLGATYGNTPAPCAPTVMADALAFGTAPREGAGYAIAAADLPLTIQAASDGACSGLPDSWSIQVSATAMAGPGGAAITPAAIAYTGTSGTAPAGLTPAPPVQLSANGQTIAIGNAELTSGTTWNATFTLTPPADAPPGTYTGTITIDTVAAGD